MNTKTTRIIILCLLTISLSSLTLAQEERQYDVKTTIIRGSDSVYEAKSASEKYTKTLRETGFDFRNYYALSSEFHSVAGGRTFSFGSSLQGISETKELGQPIKMTWKLGEIGKTDSEKIIIEGIRFGSNFPVSIKVLGDEKRQVYEYRSINFNIQRVMMKLGAPKVIATSPHPAGKDKIFFVLEINESDI